MVSLKDCQMAIRVPNGTIGKIVMYKINNYCTAVYIMFTFLYFQGTYLTSYYVCIVYVYCCTD